MPHAPVKTVTGHVTASRKLSGLLALNAGARQWASRALSAASEDLRTAGRRTGELTETAALACEEAAEHVDGIATAIERLDVSA